MMTYFTIWHYIALLIGFIIFVLTIILALREKRPNIRTSIIVSSLLVNTILAFIILMALDKYTKKAEVFNLNNYRLLQTEQIVFTGMVKNIGNYTIGTVELEIKLVNNQHTTNHIKGTNFYKSSGFLDMFNTSSKNYQPQTLIETSIIAENLKPGETRRFRVVLDYPPYFKGVSQFTQIFAH